jgi:hypothetical protein
MKNYFNEEERNTHILAIGLEGVVKCWLEKTNALSNYEKEELETALEHIQNFNDSIFERLGASYRRKIEGTMETKTVRVQSKYGTKNDNDTHCAKEDLLPLIDDLRAFSCIDCEKTNHLNCPMYNIAIACELIGHDTDGCPYKW